MRIGEVAERAGLTTKALRFYEQAGVLPVPARAASGYRDYDQGVLTRLGFVRAAQAAGLTLAEIRTIIEVRESEGPPCEHVTALLDRHAAALDVRIAELEANPHGGSAAAGPRRHPGPGSLRRGRRLPGPTDRRTRQRRDARRHAHSAHGRQMKTPGVDPSSANRLR